MLGQKTNLNKFKRRGKVQSISSDHDGVKLKIKAGKFWKTNKYVEIKHSIHK